MVVFDTDVCGPYSPKTLPSVSGALGNSLALEHAWAVEAPSIDTTGPNIDQQAPQHWTTPRVASRAVLVPGPASPPVGGAATPAARHLAPTSGRQLAMLPALGA